MINGLAQRRWLLLLSLGVIVSLIAGGAWAVDFPKLTGRVVDNAGLLSGSDVQELTRQLKAHEEKTTNQVVVVTVNTLQGLDIADYGYQLGRHWNIGQKDANNGVLLLVAPKQRKVRIEVGYGLEATLTDALSQHVIDSEIIPHFKQKDFAGGIKAGTIAVLGILDGSVDVARYKESRPVSRQNKPEAFVAFVFFTLFFGQFLGWWMTILVSAAVVFILAFVVGFLLHGLGFALLVSVISTIFHLFTRLGSGDGGSGGGGFGGGYGSGGYSGGGGSFSGGGGSFGGGGASGGW